MENKYEPEILEPYEIAEQPDNIFDDLRTASGKSITELQWDDDSEMTKLEDEAAAAGFCAWPEEEEGQCDDYVDCDDEFENLWKKVNELEEQVTKLYEIVHNRKGPPIK
jgi:hypothetical protein